MKVNYRIFFNDEEITSTGIKEELNEPYKTNEEKSRSNFWFGIIVLCAILLIISTGLIIYLCR